MIARNSKIIIILIVATTATCVYYREDLASFLTSSIAKLINETDVLSLDQSQGQATLTNPPPDANDQAPANVDVGDNQSSFVSTEREISQDDLMQSDELMFRINLNANINFDSNDSIPLKMVQEVKVEKSFKNGYDVSLIDSTNELELFFNLEMVDNERLVAREVMIKFKDHNPHKVLLAGRINSLMSEQMHYKCAKEVEYITMDTNTYKYGHLNIKFLEYQMLQRDHGEKGHDWFLNEADPYSCTLPTGSAFSDNHKSRFDLRGKVIFQEDGREIDISLGENLFIVENNFNHKDVFVHHRDYLQDYIEIKFGIKTSDEKLIIDSIDLTTNFGWKDYFVDSVLDLGAPSDQHFRCDETVSYDFKPVGQPDAPIAGRFEIQLLEFQLDSNRSLEESFSTEPYRMSCPTNTTDQIGLLSAIAIVLMFINGPNSLRIFLMAMLALYHLKDEVDS